MDNFQRAVDEMRATQKEILTTLKGLTTTNSTGNNANYNNNNSTDNNYYNSDTDNTNIPDSDIMDILTEMTGTSHPPPTKLPSHTIIPPPKLPSHTILPPPTLSPPTQQSPYSTANHPSHTATYLPPPPKFY